MKTDILLRSAFLVSSVFILSSVVAVKALNIEPGFSEALSPVFKAKSLRLAGDVKPVNYKLSFTPDLEKARFEGDEDLQLNIATEQSALILNSAEEVIDDAFLIDTKTQKKFEAATVAYDTSAEQVSISFKSIIAPGAYSFHCHFKGLLNDKLRGFYRSKFHDAAGDHFIATTQMEAADARRMFPCFDEPSFKATFNISTIVDKSLEAISNEAVASVVPAGEKADKKRVTFATTPKMSSYLVALIVGPFVGTKAVVVDGVPIRIWSIGEKSNQLSFASAATAKLLPFYNNYFGIKYPNSKLDLIAIPDFEAGAMENLGAITFRESMLLYDEKDGSVNGQMRVTGVIAHEMAHMWFGDLVTMAWWDDLWLNEGFATWMSSKAVNDVKPEWHEWDGFTNTREEALEHDSLNVSRPIHASVASAADADEMFDSITYSKGASIMRMLETYIGEDVFREGIRLYMAKHKFANATKNDLWEALGAASHYNVDALMKEWTEKPGYPLISMTQALPGANKVKVSLNQQRFLFTNNGKHSSDTLWQVPITMRSPLNDECPEPALLTTKENTFDVKDSSSHLFFNAGGNGYYRTAYAAADLKFLSENSPKLTVPERASLAADTWALTKASKIAIVDFLNLTRTMQNDDNPYVQEIFINGYYGLYDICAESALDSLSGFIQKQLLPLKEKFGWSGAKDDPLTKDLRQILRSKILITLGTIGGEKQTIEQAREHFKTYLQTPAQIEGGMLEPMTFVVAFNGNASDYEKILSLYKTAKSSEVEHRNLEALMYFRQPELIQRTLAMTLTDTIRTQDAPRLLQDGLSYKASQEATWNFIKAHWAEINKRFPGNMVRKMVKSTSAFHSEAMQKDLHDFIAKHPIDHAQRSVAETFEFVQVNVQFARQADALAKALKTIN